MKYKVSGYAFCPLEVACEIEATSDTEAIAKAKALVNQNPSAYVVANSEDTSHWHDWAPFAEVMPNVKDQPRRSPSATKQDGAA